MTYLYIFTVIVLVLWLLPSACDFDNAKLGFAGRALLTAEERAMGTPWYAGAKWLERKNAIAVRIEKRNERAMLRKLALKDKAKGIKNPNSILSKLGLT